MYGPSAHTYSINLYTITHQLQCKLKQCKLLNSQTNTGYLPSTDNNHKPGHTYGPYYINAIEY